MLSGFPSRRWGSQEGLGAQSEGSGSAWASGFQPGGTVVRKALEDARQQRCGPGPGDLGSTLTVLPGAHLDTKGQSRAGGLSGL